jgi:hypothetical protein
MCLIVEKAAATTLWNELYLLRTGSDQLPPHKILVFILVLAQAA